MLIRKRKGFLYYYQKEIKDSVLVLVFIELRPVLLQDYFGTGLSYYFVAGAEIVPQKGVCNRNKTSA